MSVNEVPSKAKEFVFFLGLVPSLSYWPLSTLFVLPYVWYCILSILSMEPPHHGCEGDTAPRPSRQTGDMAPNPKGRLWRLSSTCPERIGRHVS